MRYILPNLVVPDLARKQDFRKYMKVEMLIGTEKTTLYQIFKNIIINSKVIVKSILDPDDNFERSLQALMDWQCLFNILQLLRDFINYVDVKTRDS